MSIGQLIRHGTTRGALRGRVQRGEWIRVTRGVIDLCPQKPAETSWARHRQRAAWIGLLSMEPDAISVGACALALHGVWGLPTSLTPEIALPGGRYAPGAPGVLVRQYRTPMTTVPYRGRRIAHPVTALAQALPSFGPRRAVAILDSALQRRVIDPTDLDDLRMSLRRRRHNLHLHGCWSRIDGRAESPPETYARLTAIDAGIPPDDLQIEIRLPDGRNARGDLGWRRDDGTWVLAEIDSREYHDTPQALFRDRARQNSIALVGGYSQFRFLDRDVFDGTFVRVIAQALGRG